MDIRMQIIFGNLSHMMQVFIDEFVTKMAEFYANEPVADHRQAAE